MVGSFCCSHLYELFTLSPYSLTLSVDDDAAYRLLLPPNFFLQTPSTLANAQKYYILSLVSCAFLLSFHLVFCSLLFFWCFLIIFCFIRSLAGDSKKTEQKIEIFVAFWIDRILHSFVFNSPTYILMLMHFWRRNLSVVK